jgi:hypothetical protein
MHSANQRLTGEGIFPPVEIVDHSPQDLFIILGMYAALGLTPLQVHKDISHVSMSICAGLPPFDVQFSVDRP